MSIEVATYVNDLQPANPPGTDPRGQGDDHLRLIKQVLQNQMPRASRPFPVKTTISKTSNYTVLSTDDQTIVRVDTTAGAVTLTLPTLLSADNGWEIEVVKISSDANPILITPPTGTIASGQYPVAAARRCIPGSRCKVYWSGTGFRAERAVNLPIGTLLDFNGSGLPSGYEWPNGQTLASVAANYPEYNAAVGSGATPDYRGRVAVTLDNLGGSSAGRLAGGVITGTAIGNVGGTDTVGLTAAMLPDITSTNPGTIGLTSTSSQYAGTTVGVVRGDYVTPNSPSVAFVIGSSTQFIPGQISVSGTLGIGAVSVKSASTSGSSTGGAHSNVQPSIMCSKILVVE